MLYVGVSLEGIGRLVRRKSKIAPWLLINKILGWFFDGLVNRLNCTFHGESLKFVSFVRIVMYRRINR